MATPLKPSPIFGDPEYQAIRYDIDSIPIPENLSSIMKSWELLCETFTKYAERLEPLNRRVIAWNPNNDLTQEVKDCWSRIYGFLQDVKTDRREFVLVGLLLLMTAFREHRIKEHDDHLANLQLEKERKIKAKIEEFFPEDVTYEQARDRVLKNEPAFTEFRNMLTMWFPKEERKIKLNRTVASLLMVLDPETERKRIAFQKKFQDFQDLRLSESDMQADPNMEIWKELERFFPENATYEEVRDRVLKDKPAFTALRAQLYEWIPEDPRKRQMSSEARSLLAFLDPQTERKEQFFQEDLQDLQRLLKSEGTDPDEQEEKERAPVVAVP